MFFKEITRYYGPAVQIAPRVTTKDCYLGGVPLKKGTDVNVIPYANHYNDSFFKDPKSFNPERW